MIGKELCKIKWYLLVLIKAPIGYPDYQRKSFFLEVRKKCSLQTYKEISEVPHLSDVPPVRL